MASGSNSFNYTDGISVKIAENYKPPKRIPMLMSYSQRLALNKLVQEPVLNYDLTIEESIKNKMYEWKKARAAVIEQRKQRLNQLSQHNDKDWDTTSSTTNNTNVTDNNEVLENKDNINESSEDCEDGQGESRIKNVNPYYQTPSGILIPKIIQNTSHTLPQQQQTKILTPVPLANFSNKSSGGSRDINYKFNNKNPFNYSEFESDTSSPFDNMELKTINDLEELAQVLKYDSDDNLSTNKTGYEQQKYQYSNVVLSQPNNKYDNIYTIDNNIPNYGLDSVHIKKFPLNGYYYNRSYHQNNQNVNENVLKTSQMSPMPSTIRSVTEIMKSLQQDLANTHVDTSKNISNISSSVCTVMPSPSPSSSNDSLDNPFKTLSTDLQKMAVSISSMGFPLPRVARACQLLEGNQKKIVEHLLAMSELLDLGFPEQQVASALIKCGNDRDKALDLLIT